MKKFYSTVGALLGFVIIVLYAIKNLALIGFSIDELSDVLDYFNLVQQYLVYALAGLAGLELVAGKKLFSFIFILILAFVVVSTFFPSVLGNI